MLLLRTSLAALAMVAFVGLAQAGSTQKDGGSRGCGSCQHSKGKGNCDGQCVGGKCVTCPKDEGPKGCSISCGTKTIEVTVYCCKCTTVCLLGPPSCGSALFGKGGCGNDGCKGGGAKGSCNDGSLFPNLGGKNDLCGKGYGCDTCRDCRSRNKKHLLVKTVEIECPVTKCEAKGAAGKKGGCGSRDKGKAPAVAPVEDIPSDPPPATIGQVGTQIMRTSHVTSESNVEGFGSFFK
jgi:hypothetical protein